MRTQPFVDILPPPSKFDDMPTTSPNYAIARIDLPDAGTHGWQVRMQRRGIKYAKFFADGVLGSSEKALLAARNWRDDLLTRLESADRARICQRSQRNSSGVVGVSKVTVITNGIQYIFWQATWSPEPGKRRCVKFSIKRYGETKAFELAVKARTEAVGH
ncbi:AP2 domain-containing protein [Rubritalea spongiae]|uniref:AP2 domain-containing protein n=1 Tax=Rubritalea spongiae TaxID=430797 RepID=A0ABW5E0U9_9BACT